MTCGRVICKCARDRERKISWERDSEHDTRRDCVLAVKYTLWHTGLTCWSDFGKHYTDSLARRRKTRYCTLHCLVQATYVDSLMSWQWIDWVLTVKDTLWHTGLTCWSDFGKHYTDSLARAKKDTLWHTGLTCPRDLCTLTRVTYLNESRCIKSRIEMHRMHECECPLLSCSKSVLAVNRTSDST